MAAVAERRPYRRWTAADTTRLRELAAGGASCYAAAKALARDPKVVREVADREGILISRPSPPPRPEPTPDPEGPYKVTLEEIAEAIRQTSRTAAELAAHFGADWRRVNGMLATLLRQGRAKRPTATTWALCEVVVEDQPSAPEVVAEVEARRYRQTDEDRAVLAEIQARKLEVCGGCAHYAGPLMRRPGAQYRGRCLVLGADVVPVSEGQPCGGRGYSPA